MKRFYIYLFAAFCTVFLGACTGNFRELNDDLSGISDGDLEADDNGFGYRLQIVQQGIYFNYDFGKGKNWPFQMTQNLNADMFSGYMHDPKPLQGGSHNSDYNLQDGWNSAMWQFTYSYVMPQIYRLEQTARELGSERRETVRSISGIRARDLNGVFLSTRGPGRGDLQCTGYRASGKRPVAVFQADKC